jgi:hypothetical protein
LECVLESGTMIASSFLTNELTITGMKTQKHSD